MFDYQVSKQAHYEEACRRFATKHNIKQLSADAGMSAQVLRNKLNPDQPHRLTVEELLTLTDLTEDPTLIDGMLAQLHCQPCVPINELSSGKVAAYVLNATSEIGKVAAEAVADGAMTAARRGAIRESVNAGIRYMTLAGLAIQSRIHANPTMASTVDAITAIGASLGMS